MRILTDVQHELRDLDDPGARADYELALGYAMLF